MNQPDEPAREYVTGEPWPLRYLTVAEAAAVMSRHRSAVLRLIHTGKLRSIRLGRSYRIREAEVLRHLASERGEGNSCRVAVTEFRRFLRDTER